MSTKSEDHRLRGNDHYKKFASLVGGKVRSRHHLLLALDCYHKAWCLARNDGDEDGSRLAAKNMAVCCGYLGKEEEGVGKKQGRFREAARHFDMAFRISEKQMTIMCAKQKTKELAELMKWQLQLGKQLETAMDMFHDFITGRDVARLKVNRGYEDILSYLNHRSEVYPEQMAVARARLNQFECLNNLAVELISEKQYKEGLDLIAECYRPQEECRRLATGARSYGRNRDQREPENLEAINIWHFMHLCGDRTVTLVRAAEDVLWRLQEVRMEWESNGAVGAGLQAVEVADELLETALKEKEELQVDLVWEVIDWYKKAVLLTKGEEVEVECRANGRIGVVYCTVLCNKEKGREYLYYCVDLAATLVQDRKINLYQLDWYRDIADTYNKLQAEQVEQEDEKWKKERSPVLQDPDVKVRLKLLSDHESDSDELFVEFLFEYMPPTHKEDWEKLKPDLDCEDLDWQKAMQKLITYWHPSRVDKDKDIKYYVVCEEITNKLTVRYETKYKSSPNITEQSEEEKEMKKMECDIKEDENGVGEEALLDVDDTIVDERMKNGKKEYLIKWKQSGNRDDIFTWEPAEIINCQNKIDDFDQRKAGHDKSSGQSKLKDGKTNGITPENMEANKKAARREEHKLDKEQRSTIKINKSSELKDFRFSAEAPGNTNTKERKESGNKNTKERMAPENKYTKERKSSGMEIFRNIFKPDDTKDKVSDNSKPVEASRIKSRSQAESVLVHNFKNKKGYIEPCLFKDTILCVKLDCDLMPLQAFKNPSIPLQKSYLMCTEVERDRLNNAIENIFSNSGLELRTMYDKLHYAVPELVDDVGALISGSKRKQRGEEVVQQDQHTESNTLWTDLILHYGMVNQIFKDVSELKIIISGKKYRKMKRKIERQIVTIKEDTESALKSNKVSLVSEQITRVENELRDLDKRFGLSNDLEEAKFGEMKENVFRKGVEDSKDDQDVHELVESWLENQRQSLKQLVIKKRLSPKKSKILSKQIDEEKRRLVKVLTDYEELKTLTGKRYKNMRRRIEVDIEELKELIEKVCPQIEEDSEDYIQKLLHIKLKLRTGSESETKKEMQENEERDEQQKTFDTKVKKQICKIEDEFEELQKLTGEKYALRVQEIDEEIKKLAEKLNSQCKLLKLDSRSATDELLRLKNSFKLLQVKVDRKRAKEREEKEKMMKKKCNRPECDNKGLHRCKRCKTVAYCCQDCLTLHWTDHMRACDIAVLEKEREKEVD